MDVMLIWFIENVRWLVAAELLLFQGFFLAAGILASIRTGKPVRGKNREANIAIILFVLTFAVVLVTLFAPRPPFWFYIMEPPGPGYTLAGLFLLYASLVLGVYSSFYMGKSWRVGIVQGQKTELVQTGIFRYLRNPYFQSYYMKFLGLLLISPGGLLIALVLLSSFSIYRMVLAEEKYLLELHGEPYRLYMKSSYRFIPPF